MNEIDSNNKKRIKLYERLQKICDKKIDIDKLDQIVLDEMYMWHIKRKHKKCKCLTKEIIDSGAGENENAKTI